MGPVSYPRHPKHSKPKLEVRTYTYNRIVQLVINGRATGLKSLRITFRYFSKYVTFILQTVPQSSTFVGEERRIGDWRRGILVFGNLHLHHLTSKQTLAMELRTGPRDLLRLVGGVGERDTTTQRFPGYQCAHSSLYSYHHLHRTRSGHAHGRLRLRFLITWSVTMV